MHTTPSESLTLPYPTPTRIPYNHAIINTCHQQIHTTTFFFKFCTHLDLNTWSHTCSTVISTYTYKCKLPRRKMYLLVQKVTGYKTSTPTPLDSAHSPFTKWHCFEKFKAVVKIGHNSIVLYLSWLTYNKCDRVWVDDFEFTVAFEIKWNPHSWLRNAIPIMVKAVTNKKKH